MSAASMSEEDERHVFGAMIDLHQGDCLSVMRGMADNSVDSIVTDPPYGLAFMGKKWDHNVPSVEIWAECLRVLKPGGHLLSFGGSRTYHRLTCAIEDAGFEIRDQIMWLYGSGFPKSHNLTGDWQGWGTALKPAHEPICVARKPLVGTVAANVLEHGTGAINVDGCRIPGVKPQVTQGVNSNASSFNVAKERQVSGDPHEGRWPANLIHDGSEEVLAGFPATTSGVKSGGQYGRETGVHAGGQRADGVSCYGDTGSAARFFYCAKASKQDRDEGLSGDPQPVVTFATANGTSGKPSSISEGRNTAYKNTHPTVKPTALMRYLCRLVTPPGGVVLDPFMGSGSTGKAAKLEGFGFVGIELDADYVEIARARIG